MPGQHLSKQRREEPKGSSDSRASEGRLTERINLQKASLHPQEVTATLGLQGGPGKRLDRTREESDGRRRATRHPYDMPSANREPPNGNKNLRTKRRHPTKSVVQAEDRGNPGEICTGPRRARPPKPEDDNKTRPKDSGLLGEANDVRKKGRDQCCNDEPLTTDVVPLLRIVLGKKARVRGQARGCQATPLDRDPWHAEKEPEGADSSPGH